MISLLCRAILGALTAIDHSMEECQAVKCSAIFGANGHWVCAGRDLYCSTPAVPRDLGFRNRIWKTAHLVASYDKQEVLMTYSDQDPHGRVGRKTLRRSRVFLTFRFELKFFLGTLPYILTSSPCHHSCKIYVNVLASSISCPFILTGFFILEFKEVCYSSFYYAVVKCYLWEYDTKIYSNFNKTSSW